MGPAHSDKITPLRLDDSDESELSSNISEDLEPSVQIPSLQLRQMATYVSGKYYEIFA